LAGRKLISVLNDLQSAETVGGALVLSADTVGQNVAGQLIGTPETSDQALDMLRNLVGRRHTIVSAAAWADCGKHHAIVDEATVEIGAVSDDELQAYVATGQWQGKAGGYNLAERLAAGWSITVEGDPDTVMGLPMQQLLPKLLASGLQREGTLQKV
jgi:septum formation protein